jgi:hypothetical protein
MGLLGRAGALGAQSSPSSRASTRNWFGSLLFCLKFGGDPPYGITHAVRASVRRCLLSVGAVNIFVDLREPVAG